MRTRMDGEAAPRPPPEEAADTAIWRATPPDDGPSGWLYLSGSKIDSAVSRGGYDTSFDSVDQFTRSGFRAPTDGPSMPAHYAGIHA